jgi:dTDP-4-dehydrorhamnose reductase
VEKNKNMKRIAITGSTGLVGSRIIELLKNDFQFIPLSHKEVDITNKEQVKNAIKNIEFDIFLHLAAYTNVDKAEIEKDLVYKINVEGTKNLYEVVDQKEKQFIYFSTDFVFDGTSPPYFEDSIPNPISVYGQTKYEGEKVVAGKAMIIRISYPYRKSFAGKKDFVQSIKSLLEEGKAIKMVTDSIITPTFVDDIAYGLKHFLNNYSPEVFHLVGADSLSPYEAGKTIVKTFALNESLIEPTTYNEYFKNKAKRPQFSQIKTKKNYFVNTHTFEAGLSGLC